MNILIKNTRTISEPKTVKLEKVVDIPSWVFWNYNCSFCGHPIDLQSENDICIAGISRGCTFIFHEDCFNDNVNEQANAAEQITAR